MADIIDLDFYRKFRVVIPVKSSAFAKGKAYGKAKNAVKPYRRRRKIDPHPPSRPTNREGDGPI